MLKHFGLKTEKQTNGSSFALPVICKVFQRPA